MYGLRSEPQGEKITGEGELVGDEQHELGPHEPEGTPVGSGGSEGGGVHVGITGVTQGAA
jgi:hypothetical protein